MVLCRLRQNLCRLLAYGSGKAIGSEDLCTTSKHTRATANAIWHKTARLPQRTIPTSATNRFHRERRSTAALQHRLFPQLVPQFFRHQLYTRLHCCKNESCKILTSQHVSAHRRNCSPVRISGCQIFYAVVSEKRRMHAKSISKKIWVRQHRTKILRQMRHQFFVI